MGNLKKLTILHSNDMHGDFMAEQKDGKIIGGMSMLSGYLQKVRAEEEAVLYAISGDMFRGSVIDSEYKGLSTIEIMNMLAPDVATLGNHEVDYGIAHLLFLEKCSRFPIINANLYLTTNQIRLFKSHVILEINGMRILFIGVLTESVLAQARQERLIGSFVDVHEAAQEVGKICNAYKTEDIDLTVLLTHIGFDDDKKLAEALDPRWGVDMIIGGHSHTLLTEPCVVAGIPIVQAATGTDQIGRFDIVVDKDRNTMESYKWELIPIDDSHCPRDKALEQIIEKYHSATTEKYSRYITRFTDTFTHPVRNRETQLGRLFADIMRDNLRLDIMLMASGSLRLKELGPIVTLRDLTNMFPFTDEVVQMKITGKQFKAMMDFLFRPEAIGHDHSEFYQFSGGVKIVVSEKEGKVVELTYLGNPIEDDQILRVGLQGYHYRNMKDIFNITEEEASQIAPCKVLATVAMDVLEEDLSQRELVSCPADARWIMVP
jgi:5'-nucleotidase